MFILISLKTEIARSVRGPKLQGLRAEDAKAVPRADNFGDLITADHKVLSDNCESPMCSRGAGLGHSMDPVVSVSKKNFAGNPEQSPIGSLKSFTLTIPWNSAKLVKISLGIIARLHHTDQKQMGLLREQSAEKGKAPLLHCCNQV